jgi:hypothetical protein
MGLQDLIQHAESASAELTEAAGSATGQTLHEALQSYSEYIRREFQDSDGTITDNGKTKTNQIKAIMRYVPDVDLGHLLDFDGVDEVFGVFRRRPISARYGTPMKPKSCANYIGELDRFFKWLHRSSKFRWRRPEDYADIERRPRPLDEDVEKEAEEVEVWSIKELEILNKYATPIERLFLLLGLNCAYGADQSGRLRIRDLRLHEDQHSYIRRIRRKKKTLSIHLLWQQTTDGLRWAKHRREKQDFTTDILLLTDDNLAYWRKTDGGNRARAIPELWGDLFDRIRRDYPTFRWLPFNSLRDTSANMIRQIAGEEVASVHLAHKHQSNDPNLRRYTNPVRKRHFKAIRKLERKLASVFEAAGDDPWQQQRKSYIGRKKAEQLVELYREGVPVRTIAKELGITSSTVYRNLEYAGVERNRHKKKSKTPA